MLNASGQLVGQLRRLQVRVALEHLQRLVATDGRHFQHAEIAALGQARKRLMAQIMEGKVLDTGPFDGVVKCRVQRRRPNGQDHPVKAARQCAGARDAEGGEAVPRG